MVHAEYSVEIKRPASEVFDFLADETTMSQWRPGVLEVAHQSGSGVGATYSQTLSGPGGRKIPGDYRITEYDKPRRFAFEVIAGPLRPTGLYEISEASAGTTTVRFTLNATPKGFMKLMGGMIKKQMTAEVASLENLKSVLEKSEKK